MTLEKALKFALKWEGGFVDHPADPGGKTNKGITQRTFSAYLGTKSKPSRSVANISNAEVKEIYKDDYWNPLRCDELDEAVAIAVFDTSVNFGPRRAALFLQEAIYASGNPLNVDGMVGPKTIAAANKSASPFLVNYIGFTRMAYRFKRATEEPSQEVFLKGWLNRDNDLVKTCYPLADWSGINEKG